MLVYASLTESEMSWRWSSTSSSATSWSLRVASVAARFLPKSKRSWLRATFALRVWLNSRKVMVAGAVVMADDGMLLFLLLVVVTLPVSWGRRGASAWSTRQRAAAYSKRRAVI